MKALTTLARFVGAWTTEATHPQMPGTIVKGTATFEWLEGEKFLIHRGRNEHEKFPDSISIIGYTDRDREEGEAGDEMTFNYFDSRGVSRVYQASIEGDTLTISRESPGFSQRLEYKLTDGDNTIVGTSQLCEDDVTWNADLAITYRRRA